MSDTATIQPAARRWWPYVAVAFLTFVSVMGTLRGGEEMPEAVTPDALAFLIVVTCPLSLLWLRRAPVVVLGLIVTLTGAYLMRGYPYGPVMFSVIIAVVGNVVHGNRIAAWSGAAAMYAVAFASSPLRDEPITWNRMLGVGAWVLVILLIGEFIRIRCERASAAREARAEAQRRQANEERLRIAHELHDVVAHHMSLINVQAGVALHLIEREPERVAPALETIKASSKEALGDLRSLIDVLRDRDEAAPRQPAQTLRSLDPLIERAQYAGLTVTQQVTGSAGPLPSAVEMAAHRIIQEAVTNVVRHADADRATITLDYGADMLTLRIDDNGHADPNGLLWGNGIRGMRERAVALGGDLVVRGAPAGGVRVEVTLRTEER